jgi:hypothetical protein
MHWKETGGVEKLFALPGRLLHSQPLFKHYQRNLTAKPAEDENVSAYQCCGYGSTCFWASWIRIP